MALDTVTTRGRRRGTLWAALIAFVLAAASFGLVGAAPVSAETPTTVVLTDPALYSYEQGTLSTGSGAERNASTQDNTTRIRLTDKVAVNPSWTSMTFAGASDIVIIVFAYDAGGGFIAQSSTGWNDPSGAGFTWALPAGTAYVDVVVRHTDSSVISVGDRSPWLTVSATTGAQTGTEPPGDGATVITDPTFYAYESGTIASANGAPGASTTRIRLTAPVPVDPAWTTLQFATTNDVQVTVFAYDADGAYLSPSTGWQSLSNPYVYTIPPGTAMISYVLREGDGSAEITPTTFGTWVTISATSTPPGTTPASPVPLDDPAWNAYEQGTIAAADGTERDNASDVATRIRLKTAPAIDPSAQALKLDAGMHGAGLSVTIFAYDANGHFISPSSGWKSLSSPYVYLIPPGTVRLDWALTHDTGAVNPISVSEQTQWLTLSYVVPDPRDNYIVDAQTITPQFTIPGISASQGGNFVDGNLWEATASDDGEGAANGNVYVYSMDYQNKTATLIHHFKHNFGHLNSFSYDQASGNLIFGNGSGSYTQLPRFYVVKESNIDLDGTNTLASVHATTFTVPDNFGAKANVIWTDQPNVAVMLTDDGITVRKIRLATGTEHLDLGTYTPAPGGQYNGTWTVLDTYHINNAYDVVQSASWIDGHLVIGLGHGPMSIAVIDFDPDGTHMHYVVHRDAADSQFFESLFYDPVHHLWGGANASTGSGWFWNDTNFTFTSNPPPTITATVNPSAPDGSNGWYTTAPTVALTATDQAGATPAISYSTDGGATWTSYSGALSAPEGTTTYQLLATDPSGETSQPSSLTLNVDTVAPVTTATASPTSTSVTLALAATDTTSGVATTQYRVDNQGWTSYTAPVAIPRSIADKIIEYRTIDVAGNIETSSRVTVTGASTQLNDLGATVQDLDPGTALADKIAQAATLLAANDIPDTLATLRAFTNQVAALAGKTLDVTEAAQLTAAATAIEAILRLS